MPSFFNRLILKYRIVIIIAMHAAFAAGALYLSFLLRFDFTLGYSIYPGLFILSFPINAAIFLIVAGFFNLYQGIWRYVSVDDLKILLKLRRSPRLFLCSSLFSAADLPAIPGRFIR